MPGGLSLSQRLTGPDGLPTVAARVGVVALMAVAAATGYAAGPDGAAPAARSTAPVAISRLSGDLPIATPEPRPELRAAAALPAIRERSARRRPARRSAPRQARAVATPEPSATPAASATPTPPAAAPVPAATPAPPAPAADPAPRRAPTPTETFDSSG